MKRDVARELLTPYLDGELDARTAGLLEAHLASDADLRRELDQLRELFDAINHAPALEPDDEMRRSFDALLSREKQQAASGGSPDGGSRVFRFPSFLTPVWLAGAAASVAAGVFVGWQLAHRDDEARDAAHEQTLAEVQSLRRDVGLLRGMLASGKLSNSPASFRIQTMSLAGEMEVSDPDVLEALFQTLDEDPSANVRLAAIEALRRFQDEPEVRSRLAESLPRQTDPLVQIALIGVLVDAGAEEARSPMEGLLTDPSVAPIVKGTAQQGLTRL